MARTGSKKRIESITELPDREDFLAFVEANPRAGDPDAEGYPRASDAEDEIPHNVVERAYGASARYTNEAQKLYTPHEFTPEEWEEWFLAQSLGTLPFNAVTLHHTYRPSQHQWLGIQSIHNLRAFYRDTRGWPDGRMPHLFITDGRGSYAKGSPRIFTATHPAHDGIAAINANHRTIGIECVHDAEVSPFTDEMMELLGFICRVLAKRRGGKVFQSVSWRDGPASWNGFQIHRLIPGNSTSCYGTRNMAPTTFFGRLAKLSAEPKLPAPPPPEPEKPTPTPVAWLPGVKRIAFSSYSEKELDSGDPFVLTLSGDDEAVIVPKGMAFLVPKVEEKPPEKPADPKPSGAAKIIDDYFRSSYHSLGTYENIGQIIVEEAERAGIALQAACALVEQESGGRNVFGCDAGNVGDRPPYCRQPCTRERVQKLIAHIRAGGTSNGTSVCQLTYPSFIFEAEALGGAHVPRNSMRVGFKLLASYFAKYGELDGYGSFNAGEGNRASVRHTYSAACVSKSRAWRSHLGSFAAYVEEAPPLPIEEEEMTEPERPETTKPKLSKAAKAIIAAAVPLVSALLLWASTGTLDETEFSVGATGLLTALLVYFVPNSGEASTD